MTQQPEHGPRRGSPPYLPVTDDRLAEALHELEPWRGAGDSVDWDLALIAYDVPADTVIAGVPIPAGLYTREITGDGYHVIAHRWTDRTALADRLDDIERRHHQFEHIDHARPQFVAIHTAAIHAYAHRMLALIERDERAGGVLYDVAVRCWHDLNPHLGADRYADELRISGNVGAYDEDEFVTAVHDRTDTQLHERDRLLSFDEAEAAGFDGTLRDGSAPHTWASLTPRQRAALQSGPIRRPRWRADVSRFLSRHLRQWRRTAGPASSRRTDR
ncbi:hypothetical protein [Dactylosporangium sp. NPDC049140]|uniref:hypothetical protein n=1 Tax=Dactylosporangium sp. NPDC049140 TaxID=3155647 RepID=UPI0033EED0D9